MPGVLVRVACTNQKRFVFRCENTDVSLKEFNKLVLKEYETYTKQAGQKDDMPEVVRLVDSYGFTVHDQQMGDLLESGASFGLVLRGDLNKLAVQHEISAEEVLDQLCFSKEKLFFYLSPGLFQLSRADKKRSSPELSDAPTEPKGKKNKGGPVKDRMASLIAKGLCNHKDLHNKHTGKLWVMDTETGLKALKKFEELMSKNKDADKAHLFSQSLDMVAPPSSPTKGAATPGKVLAVTDGTDSSGTGTGTGKKRKKDEQAAKKDTVEAAPEVAQSTSKKAKSAPDADDKLNLAAAGKTLFTPTTLAKEGKDKTDGEEAKVRYKSKVKIENDNVSAHARMYTCGYSLVADVCCVLCVYKYF